ncbi:F0F1 ATP synthase assembly protein I [Chromatium weissei]|nr:F0F1 ATP synthase assembly protein I [Chromatium weissei]
MQHSGVFQAKLLLQTQIVFGFVVSFIALFSSDAIAVAVGSGVCCIANTLLAALIFRNYRAQEIPHLTRRFYQGEILKIAVVLSLFTLAWLTFDNLNIPVMLGAYFITQIIPTLIAAQFGSRNPM